MIPLEMAFKVQGQTYQELVDAANQRIARFQPPEEAHHSSMEVVPIAITSDGIVGLWEAKVTATWTPAHVHAAQVQAGEGDG